MLELRREIVVQLDADPPVLSVGRGIGGVVAQDVIAAVLLLYVFEPNGGIVGVEKGLAAGVRRERRQSLRRVVDGGALRVLYGAAEEAAAARRSLRRAAARRSRHQAAGVDRIDGNVGLHRSIDRRFELRLILDAGLANSAREIDQRLLLRQC